MPRRKRLPVGSSWPPARIALLRELWPDPDLSQRQVGKRLGMSASAAKSMAHALGLGPKPVAPGRIPALVLASLERAGAVRSRGGAAEVANAQRRVERRHETDGAPPWARLAGADRSRTRAGPEPLAAFHPISLDALPRPGVRVEVIAAA